MHSKKKKKIWGFSVTQRLQEFEECHVKQPQDYQLFLCTTTLQIKNCN
jgi:hypothetical protein